MGAATHARPELTLEVRAVLDALPVAALAGSAVRDASGRVVDLRSDHVNPVAAGDPGLPSPTGAELFGRIVEVIRSRRPATFEVDLRERHFAAEVTRFGDGYLALLRDVTDARRAEARLRANEGRLAEAQRVASLGVWEWDVASGEVRWTEELFTIYGITPANYRPSYEGYLTRVHPEDRDRVAGVIAQAVEDGQQFAFSERIVRPDGTVRTLFSGGRVTLGEDGRPARMLGVCHDVTDFLGESLR